MLLPFKPLEVFSWASFASDQTSFSLKLSDPDFDYPIDNDEVQEWLTLLI